MVLDLPTLLTSLLVLCGVALWVLGRRSFHKERAYKSALESNQKRLDHQTSRLNILTKALANLPSLINHASDMWKSLVLDEARALVQADGASFWRFLESEGEFECEISRGSETHFKEGSFRIKTDAPVIAEAFTKRVAILRQDSAGGVEPGWTLLIVPLMVTGSLWGLFRFSCAGREKLTQRESELVDMFIKQVAMALENREMVQNRERFYLELVQTLADALDSRDASTEGQTRRVRKLARDIARELDLPEEFIHYLEFAALMHDIGKIAIDDQVLKKPGKLTPEEYELIKKHPEIGHKILAPVQMLAPVAPMVLYHQEWFNGKGYPEGLSGEEIPLGARIVAILDAWGAMTSDRPWRPALRPEQAMEEIKKGAGTQFDPRVVDAFVSALEKQGII